MDRIWRLIPRFVLLSIGHVDNGIIFFCIENSDDAHTVQHSVNSGWQFNTQ